MIQISDFSRRIFLVGSARSGTTLVGNILQSHPETFYFHEILSREDKLLPGLNLADLLATRDSRTCREGLDEAFQRLVKYKYSWCGNTLRRNRLLLGATVFTVKALANLGSRLFGKAFERSPFYKMHHLNGLTEPLWKPMFLTLFRKVRRPSVLLIKEVRPRHTFAPLRLAYPDAQFVHLMRHPYATVEAQMRFYKRKKAGDPYDVSRPWLEEAFPERHALIKKHFDTSFSSRLALQWRLENEFVADHMGQGNVRLRFEDVVGTMESTARRLYGDLGMDYGTQVESYVHAVASWRSPQRHSRSTLKGASAVAKPLPEELVAEIKPVLRDCALMEEWS